MIFSVSLKSQVFELDKIYQKQVCIIEKSLFNQIIRKK